MIKRLVPNNLIKDQKLSKYLIATISTTNYHLYSKSRIYTKLCDSNPIRAYSSSNDQTNEPNFQERIDKIKEITMKYIRYTSWKDHLYLIAYISSSIIAFSYGILYIYIYI